MNCIPHFQTPLINFVALICTNFASTQCHASIQAERGWWVERRKKKKKKRLQFVIWLKNDKHLLEHGTWRKRQSFRGNSVSSANSIIIWYLRRIDLIWWNSDDIRPISSRWGWNTLQFLSRHLARGRRPLWKSVGVQRGGGPWQARETVEGLSPGWLIKADIWMEMS